MSCNTGNVYIQNIEDDYKIWKRKIAIEGLLSGKILDDSYKEYVKSFTSIGPNGSVNTTITLPFQKEYWL